MSEILFNKKILFLQTEMFFSLKNILFNNFIFLNRWLWNNNEINNEKQPIRGQNKWELLQYCIKSFCKFEAIGDIDVDHWTWIKIIFDEK